MNKRSLPPRLPEIKGSKIAWERLEGIDYELLGYFLSAHLIIEHYLDQMLKVMHPELDWDSSKQTFGQKIALLSRLKLSEKYDAVPAIKHLNSLRNKISHRVNFQIKEQDLLPLAQYLRKACDVENPVPTARPKRSGSSTSRKTPGYLATA